MITINHEKYSEKLSSFINKVPLDSPLKYSRQILFTLLEIKVITLFKYELHYAQRNLMYIDLPECLTALDLRTF